jgi:hypothetical protein
MSHDFRLVISDVDGTLLTPHKELSKANIEAVRRLREAGIHFALVSSRPILGMKWLIDELDVQAMCAGFNGGLIVDTNLSVIKEHDIPQSSIATLEAIIHQHKLDLWIYTRDRWLVPSLDAYHVQANAKTIHFQPEVFSGLDRVSFGEIIKLVGTSDDFDAVEACEQSIKVRFGDSLSASRSQVQYIDITHALANKGSAAVAIAAALNVPLKKTVTIGDADNDIQMFHKSGLSIAMGQAMPEVRRAALQTTLSNSDDGFSWAIDAFVLRHLQP